MIALLIALATSVLPGAAGAETCTAIPGTVLQTSFTAPSFREDTRLEAQLAASAGEGVMLAGTIEPAGSILTLQFRKDQPHRSSADWRSELGQGPGESFDVEGVACRETQAQRPGLGAETHFEAYVVAAGFVFDLHVATHDVEQAAGLSRSDFEKVVRSFRVAFVRHGQPTQLPRDVRDAMQRAFAGWPSWRRTLDAELARKPDDAALSFTLGELLVLTNSSANEILAAHTKALAGFQKLRTPSTEQRFAWMLSEQALGLVTLDSGKPADALPHLQASYTIAGQLRSSSRGMTAYALAQVHANSGAPADAVRFLDEAIQSDSHLRDRARSDKALSALSSDKRFQALMRR